LHDLKSISFQLEYCWAYVKQKTFKLPPKEPEGYDCDPDPHPPCLRKSENATRHFRDEREGQRLLASGFKPTPSPSPDPRRDGLKGFATSVSVDWRILVVTRPGRLGLGGDVISGYSGATASAFHRLPFTFHAYAIF
jgi:hypothetical protein